MIRLYDDELGDRGTTSVSVRIRVMDDFFLVLLRQYCRVDGEMVRMRDTRVFHAFGSPLLLKDVQTRVATVEQVRAHPAPTRERRSLGG